MHSRSGTEWRSKAGLDEGGKGSRSIWSEDRTADRFARDVPGCLSRSVDGSLGDDPLAGLPGDLCDEIEIRVVVEER